ncbi:MAG: CDP-alcohol phosphatidyltransferase family protein, partial [Kiritimatiellaceae bacterium]|nr:CDP-alcohol phosphatidyltransferase family protein [Kiritimatiellaceae bacterium]
MKQTKFSMWKDLSFIPCSITLCNALCGLSAIICMISPRSAETTVPFFAILLIFAAMFFDIFDGFAARKLKAESMHGMELDSLSDMLSFGIAPAILIFVTGQGWHQNLQPFHWVAWLAAGFFTVCALWRLAQYNTV